MFSVIRIAASRFSPFFQRVGHTSPEELLYAARVLLWVRWFGLTAAFVEIHYRVDYWSLSHILNTFYCLGFLGANGYVQYLMRRRGTVKPAWLFVLSVLDVAAISFSVFLSGGFNSPYFALYYFAVAVFAYVFTSPRLVLPWTTLVVVVYSVLSVMVEPGLDIAGKDERSLFYRVVALYAVSAAVSIISGLERASRRKGLERERELQRQRIELSADDSRHHRPVGVHGRPGRRAGDGSVGRDQSRGESEVASGRGPFPVRHVGTQAPH